uniref:Regulator of microtubule dynamics 1 n=1 Tax=Catharus ustulatus TaxID=91951 RepID=A0A8C3U763_CATUS
LSTASSARGKDASPSGVCTATEIGTTDSHLQAYSFNFTEFHSLRDGGRGSDSSIPAAAAAAGSALRVPAQEAGPHLRVRFTRGRVGIAAPGALPCRPSPAQLPPHKVLRKNLQRGVVLSAGSFLVYEAHKLISGFAEVHASFKVEDVIEQADYLYGSGETEKLYRLLVQHKNSDDAELLWRLARSSRDLAQLGSTSAEEKKQLTYDSLEYAKKALEKNESNSAAHKALRYFHMAEEADPNFYSKNLLFLGKTYLKLNNKKMALLWLSKAKEYPAQTEEDKQVQKEALELLNSI